MKSPEITQSAITDHPASNFPSWTVTQSVGVCVCVGGGGGGGGGVVLSLFFIRRIGPSIYRFAARKYREYQAPPKTFSFFTFTIREDLKLVQFCRDHTPKNIYISEPPPPTKNVIQKFKPKNALRPRMYQNKYQSTPPPPPPPPLWTMIALWL